MVTIIIDGEDKLQKYSCKTLESIDSKPEINYNTAIYLLKQTTNLIIVVDSKKRRQKSKGETKYKKKKTIQLFSRILYKSGYKLKNNINISTYVFINIPKNSSK